MLRAIYKVGSSLLLPKPKDSDYAYVFDTKEECREALRKNHNHEVDNHYEAINELKTTIYAWQYPLRELVSGEEIEYLKNYSILEHKQEYKEIAMKKIPLLEDKSKIWYHIFIVCKMFEKDSTTLTKEEIKKAQKIHDKGVDKDIKNYCLMQLDLIQ